MIAESLSSESLSLIYDHLCQSASSAGLGFVRTMPIAFVLSTRKPFRIATVYHHLGR